MFKHVLIPTDGSALARKAIDAGVVFAKELGAKVTAYHALELFQQYVFADGAVIDRSRMPAFEERAREAAEKHVVEVGALCKESGVLFDSLIATPKSVYEGIIAAAAEKHCDLILLASHGRGELSALILGSTTQKVLAHSKIPVLVYR